MAFPGMEPCSGVMLVSTTTTSGRVRKMYSPDVLFFGVSGRIAGLGGGKGTGMGINERGLVRNQLTHVFFATSRMYFSNGWADGHQES